MPRRKTPKPSKVATRSPHKQLCTNDTDSGNSSPARRTTSKTDRSADTTDWKDEIIHFYRNESIRAWKFYQAAVLDRRNIETNSQLRQVADHFLPLMMSMAKGDETTPEHERQQNMGHLEKSFFDEINKVEKEVENFHKRFADNIRALDAGIDVRTLAQQNETEKEHYQFMGSLIGYVTPEKITPQRVQVDDLLTLGLSSTGTEDSEDSESFHTARSTTHTDTDGDKESSGEILDHEVQEKEAGEKVKVKGDHPKNPSIKPNEVIGEGLLGTKPKVRQQQPTVPEKDSPSSQNECGLMTFGISSQPDKISAQLNEPSANETNTNVMAGHSSESQVCSTDVKSEEESQAAVKTEKLEDITAEFHPTKSNTQGSAEISSPPTQSGDNMGPNETGKGENKNYSGTSSTKKKKDRKLKKDKTIAAENEEKVRSMQLPGEPSDAKDEKADCDHLTECESIPESHIQGIKEDLPSQETVRNIEEVDKRIVDEQFTKQLAQNWASQQTWGSHASHEAFAVQLPSAESRQSLTIGSEADEYSSDEHARSWALVTSRGKPQKGNQTAVTYSAKKINRKFPEASCLNKTSICWTFRDKKSCPWGAQCIFAHGEAELKPLPSWFKKEDYHAVVQQAKKPPEATPDHPEPCLIQMCNTRLQYFLKKTIICKQWQAGRCHYPVGECKFAHGRAELKPLPKYELCNRNKSNSCPLKSDEPTWFPLCLYKCVYAHTPEELREPDARYIDAMKRHKSASTSRMPTPMSQRSTEGSMRSNSRPSRLAVGSYTDVIDDEGWIQDQDDCIICSEEFTVTRERYKLNCGHDSFHSSCINQWLSRDASCPVCRQPVEEESLSTPKVR